MSAEPRPCILMVDDEENILKSLTRLLKELDSELVTAASGAEALKIIEGRSVSLIISDQRMPEMTGVELLKRCREISPDTERILLTGYADIDATVEAINSGAVRYYFNKPWEDDFLLSRVRDSLELFATRIENKKLHELTQTQNRKLVAFSQTLQQQVEEQTATIRKQHQELNLSFMETIKAFSTIVGLRLREVASHSQRVAILVKMLLKGLKLDAKEYQDIVIAAYLHDIGKIGLPEAITSKSADKCSPHEKEILYKHPVLGQSCMSTISGFEEISLIIRHHHENMDGTGYPDCLIGQKIPLGARILRLCDAFDHIAQQADYPDLKTLTNATAMLQRRAGSHFDPALVKSFGVLDIAHQFYHDGSQGVIGLKPADLKEGMVLAADIRTVNDVFLLPKGARLSPGMIGRINKIHNVDPIIEVIRIFDRSVSAEEEHVPA